MDGAGEQKMSHIPSPIPVDSCISAEWAATPLTILCTVYFWPKWSFCLANPIWKRPAVRWALHDRPVLCSVDLNRLVCCCRQWILHTPDKRCHASQAIDRLNREHFHWCAFARWLWHRRSKSHDTASSSMAAIRRPNRGTHHPWTGRHSVVTKWPHRNLTANCANCECRRCHNLPSAFSVIRCHCCSLRCGLLTCIEPFDATAAMICAGDPLHCSAISSVSTISTTMTTMVCRLQRSQCEDLDRVGRQDMVAVASLLRMPNNSCTNRNEWIVDSCRISLNWIFAFVPAIVNVEK